MGKSILTCIWTASDCGLQIFILEGLVSALAGIACFWLLVDTPDRSTRWLSPDEIRYLKVRQFTTGRLKPKEQKEKTFDRRIFLSVLTDWKIYLLVLAFWSNVTPNYGVSNSTTLFGRYKRLKSTR